MGIEDRWLVNTGQFAIYKYILIFKGMWMFNTSQFTIKMYISDDKILNFKCRLRLIKGVHLYRFDRTSVKETMHKLLVHVTYYL